MKALETATKKLLLVFLCVSLPTFSWAENREFKMTIDEVSIEVAPGFSNKVFAFNGQVPGPLIRVREGDDVSIQLTNNTTLPHTIHWHGINQINSWQMDGVPGVTQKAIQPGETFTYKFNADRPGTLWYHCHVNVWEHVGTRGMWGPLIVDPKEPSDLEKTVTRDVIMMMSSWESTYANTYGKGGAPHDVPDYFSINGRSFPMTQPVRLKKSEVMRLRFVGAGGDIHFMHLHGHDMLVTHKDGYPLASPYYADTIAVGPGERYDAIVQMNNPGLFMMHDHADRHMSHDGSMMGGPMMVFEYEGIPIESWYEWKDKVYDPNFYYSESMKQGYGLFNSTPFRGKPIEQGRRRK